MFHLLFSLFDFNDGGKVLIRKRSQAISYPIFLAQVHGLSFEICAFFLIKIGHRCVRHRVNIYIAI